MQLVGLEFGSDEVITLPELKSFLKKQVALLQIQINNPESKRDLVCSIAESPVRTFASALSETGMIGNRTIYCCIDEYENLLDYQQAIVNTYIKHAEPPLSFKIGVRKNGLRNRSTLDSDDLLRTPDDYAEIEISEKGFESFARNVAESRLTYARKLRVDVPPKLDQFLIGLSTSEEADLLGAERVAQGVLNELRTANEQAYRFFSELPFNRTYFLRYWQESENKSISSLGAVHI